ncbi:2-dehydropantoate 2-reductase [Mariprofundus erugo]|uniref:ketopantoate reductase family protein n=1 Tax=Mariprofundus erugo TaxID=2528639 RepID=UPI0010FEA0E3|nr:2-dehydropantoate 2-reductase [Mariprofundus erugo]TLS73713.1 2-dehydropantoate 2-reductase [Mariprofundus erugo]
MKMGFAGAGAVGCHYGSKLAQAGASVVLLARGAHLLAMQRDGLLHESEGHTLRVPMCASDDVDVLAACDVVFFACKMTGLPSLIEQLRGRLAAGTLLVTLQNGVQAPAMLADAFYGYPVVAGTAFIGARLEAPGHVIHSAAGGVRLGAWSAEVDAGRLQQLVATLQQAGIPARIEEDPVVMLWRKLLWNCGFNAMTAITRRYAGEIVADPALREMAELAMQETVAVACASGVALTEADIAGHVAITAAMGPVKTSMWQDIEAGRPVEVDYINGYVAGEAERLGLAAPVNRLLAVLVRAMAERGY